MSDNLTQLSLEKHFNFLYTYLIDRKPLIVETFRKYPKMQVTKQLKSEVNYVFSVFAKKHGIKYSITGVGSPVLHVKIHSGNVDFSDTTDAVDSRSPFDITLKNVDQYFKNPEVCAIASEMIDILQSKNEFSDDGYQKNYYLQISFIGIDGEDSPYRYINQAVISEIVDLMTKYKIHDYELA